MESKKKHRFQMDLTAEELALVHMLSEKHGSNGAMIMRKLLRIIEAVLKGEIYLTTKEGSIIPPDLIL